MPHKRKADKVEQRIVRGQERRKAAHERWLVGSSASQRPEVGTPASASVAVPAALPVSVAAPAASPSVAVPAASEEQPLLTRLLKAKQELNAQLTKEYTRLHEEVLKKEEIDNNNGNSRTDGRIASAVAEPVGTHPAADAAADDGDRQTGNGRKSRSRSISSGYSSYDSSSSSC